MGLVSFKNMREWVQRHGEVCTKCVQATTEKLKVRYIAEYDKVVLWAKQELTKEIQKLTQKKKPVKKEND
jgi:hypothetical protein